MPTKKQSERQRQQKQIRALRDAGLISKRVNIRKAPTRGVKSALKRFADVLRGKATVVDVPATVARGLKKSHRVVGNRVVIERQTGERIRYDDKTGKIVGKRKRGKRTFRRTIERDFTNIGVPKSGTKRYFVVPFSRGGGDTDYLKFDDMDELQSFMNEYEKRGYKNWKNYVEIVDVETRDEVLEEYPAIGSYQYKIGERKRTNTKRTIIQKHNAKGRKR